MDETFRAKLVEEGERAFGGGSDASAARQIVRASTPASSKIKEACWDTMETRGAAVVALAVGKIGRAQAWPLPLEDKAARLGRRVAFLRRVEMAERAHLREAERGVTGGGGVRLSRGRAEKGDPAAKKRRSGGGGGGGGGGVGVGGRGGGARPRQFRGDAGDGARCDGRKIQRGSSRCSR